MTEHNYAYESGAFMALAKFMAAEIRKLNSEEDELSRKWTIDFLNTLADQTDAALVEFGYAKK